jgi:hypothetical protein
MVVRPRIDLARLPRLVLGIGDQLVELAVQDAPDRPLTSSIVESFISSWPG